MAARMAARSLLAAAGRHERPPKARGRSLAARLASLWTARCRHGTRDRRRHADRRAVGRRFRPLRRDGLVGRHAAPQQKHEARSSRGGRRPGPQGPRPAPALALQVSRPAGPRPRPARAPPRRLRRPRSALAPRPALAPLPQQIARPRPRPRVVTEGQTPRGSPNGSMRRN